IALWRDGRINAAVLRERLVQASAALPLGAALYREAVLTDKDVIKQASLIGRLREFFAAFTAYAEAADAYASGRAMPAPLERSLAASDRIESLWAGIRAAMALIGMSVFWLLTEWPAGATAVILTTVMTARLAGMDQAAKAARGAATLFVLAML